MGERERPWSSSASPWVALVAVLGLGVTACTTGTVGHERTGSVSSAVVGGVPSTAAQDAVVLVINIAEMEGCTGTLLTPNLVLTARHCVSALDPRTFCASIVSDAPASSLYIQTGVAADGNDPTAWAARVFYGPSDSPLCGNDVALLQLDHDLVGAPTLPVRFTPPTVGETATLIGYGEDAASQATPGRYQRAGVSVLAVGATTYPFPLATGGTENVNLTAGTFLGSEAACHGDSGGPLVDANGNLVATDSTAGLYEDTCVGAPEIYTSLAQHEQLIRGAAVNAGHPLPAPTATSQAVRAEKGAPSDGELASTDATPPTSDDATVVSAGCAMAPAAPADGGAALAFAFAALGFARRRSSTVEPESRDGSAPSRRR